MITVDLSDYADGGEGFDKLIVRNVEVGTFFDFGNGSVVNGESLAWNFEVLDFDGSESFDEVKGGENNDVIKGNGGLDILHGRDGDDTLEGGAGVDFLYGGTGADTIRGGSESDVIYDDENNDKVFGDGKLLIALTPTVTSILNYYVVRIGSGWLEQSGWRSLFLCGCHTSHYQLTSELRGCVNDAILPCNCVMV